MTYVDVDSIGGDDVFGFVDNDGDRNAPSPAQWEAVGEFLAGREKSAMSLCLESSRDLLRGDPDLGDTVVDG